eukprot:2824287-Pyramimonas_sp.AAC.1
MVWSVASFHPRAHATSQDLALRGTWRPASGPNTSALAAAWLCARRGAVAVALTPSRSGQRKGDAILRRRAADR